MNDFEAKRQERIERYKRRAEAARSAATNSVRRSDDLVKHIPPGQPILVGHHSERGHRRTIERSQDLMFQSLEENKKAEYWDQRARSAASNHAIYTEDPDAIVKLQMKLRSLERKHEEMKTVNAAYRKRDYVKLAELGYSTESIEKWRTMLEGDISGGRLPYAKWELTNSGANIRRVRKQIESIEQKKAKIPTEQTIGEVEIIENVEENRVQMFFPGKPDVATRSELKSRGFRWSPRNGCWQRHLSALATSYAESIAKKLAGGLAQ